LRFTILATGIIKKGSKVELGSHNSKAFNIFAMKNSYAINIAHNIDNTAAGSLKFEQWGSILFQGGKYQEEKATISGINNSNNNKNK